MRSRRMLIVLAAIVMLVSGAASASAASAPYESYNYNYWRDAVPSPEAYMPSRSITGENLGIGNFLEPSDMYSTNGNVYVLDRGNNRIVVMDSKWKLKRVISEFDNNGKQDGFNKPEGLFAATDGSIYVADTANKRIVILNAEGKLAGIIQDPKSDILASNFEFVPLKLTVDRAKRVYVVTRGVFEGIVQFDSDGTFIGFVGTNKVQPNAADYAWRLYSTKAQREKMVLFIPTEFSNVDIDSKGFVYATNIDPGSDTPVKRISPSGDDVLKRYGYFPVKGDIRYRQLGVDGGPSTLVDVKVRDNGMYSVLDSLRSRIFTYDEEGNLLYVFGGKGNQLGTFKLPVAIEAIGERMAVLDQGRGRIVEFTPTKFGSSVNKAVALHNDGQDQAAVKVWQEVLKLNSNYDIAYIGIGKSYLMEKRNKEAMTYFKLGLDRKDYSVAYKRYRREVIKEHFGQAMTVVLVIALASCTAWMVTRYRRRRRLISHEG
jgi:NHL repeat.